MSDARRHNAKGLRYSSRSIIYQLTAHTEWQFSPNNLARRCLHDSLDSKRNIRSIRKRVHSINSLNHPYNFEICSISQLTFLPSFGATLVELNSNCKPTIRQDIASTPCHPLRIRRHQKQRLTPRTCLPLFGSHSSRQIFHHPHEPSRTAFAYLQHLGCCLLPGWRFCEESSFEFSSAMITV